MHKSPLSAWITVVITVIYFPFLTKIAHSATYTALGDSYTANYSASAPEYGFVPQLNSTLAATRGSWTLINRGVPGYTSLQVRDEPHALNAGIQDNPQLVTVLVGINDVIQSYWAHEPTAVLENRFRSAYTTILSRLRNETSAFIITATIPDISRIPATWNLPPEQQELAREGSLAVNNVIKSVASTFDVPVVDLFTDRPQYHPYDRTHFDWDGYHPNDFGYTLIAELFRAELTSLFVVTTQNDDGAGSLRQTILTANAHPNGPRPDVIQFNIPGPGVQTIRVPAPLPVVTDPVHINGYTQPSSRPNTFASGNSAVLRIQLDGGAAGGAAGSHSGLAIQAGSSTVEGLIVSRFAGNGIDLLGNGNNVISGNFIGTNTTGTISAANLGAGIFVDSPANTIGGHIPQRRNIISGNTSNGISLSGGRAVDNRVLGNYIGLDASGSFLLGNVGPGVLISGASNNSIGDVANVIAGNGTAGIHIVGAAATGNRLVHNSIFGNRGLGIDLDEAGTNANDEQDLDSGANNLQNHPVLLSADSRGLITGMLDSVPNTTFYLEFFANTATDPSSPGEAEVLVGIQDVTTNPNGQASFAANFTFVAGKPFITATASNIATGDTSELSNTLSIPNSAPVNIVPGTQVINQDVPLVFSPANNRTLAVSDVDGDTASNPLQVTLIATNGVFRLSDTSGLTANNSNGTGNTVVTLGGSAQALNAALDGLVFIPNAFFSGTASLVIIASDSGSTGGGRAQSDSDTILIQVNAAPRQLSIQDVAVTEGNNDTANAVFIINLSAPSVQPITVQFTTEDSTATLNNDYVPLAGTLTFEPGMSRRTITVAVKGDPYNEASETFLVRLLNPGGAIIVDENGVGTIVNDDPLPSLTINDVSLPEGHGGLANASFRVTLSPVSGQGVSVDFNVVPTNAAQGNDYEPTSGTLFFSPGQNSQTIAVPVRGDQMFEADEGFNVNLLNPVNATLARAQGLGVIVNDEPLAPVLSKPSIVVTAPQHGAVLNGFPAVAGQTGGVGNLQVGIVIQRRNDQRFYTGSAWSKTAVLLPVAAQDGAFTTPSSLLPRGALLLDDVYTVATVAFDGLGNRADAAVSFSIDQHPPQVSIGYPSAALSLRSLSYISGRAVDPAYGSGVTRVDLSLQRVSDKKFWNGTDFVATTKPGGITLTTILSGSAWIRRSGLPSGRKLLPGSYLLRATALDRSQRKSTASLTFTIRPPVELSFATVQTRFDSIGLRFTGVLDAISASDTDNYSVLVNGQSVPLESVSYNSRNYTVVVTLPEHSVTLSDQVIVKWRNLMDKNGVALSGQTGPLIAR